MDEERIGLVLARATELRLKITNCIHKATSTSEESPDGPSGAGQEEGNEAEDLDIENEGKEEEESVRLWSICDALESLEKQLSSLQDLQHQQRYEREVALSQIENSRKMLLGKLKEYRGKGLEVIHETCNFAGETVEHNDDLLLPPYPSRPPYSLCLENGYAAQIPTVQKSVRNGLITIGPKIEAKKTLKHKKVQHGSNGSRKGLGFFLSSAAKTVITVVGVVSILSLSGLGPKFGKRGTRFNILGLFKEKSNIQCPPGKVLVVESGVARCLVKERIEIPFSAVSASPDINYGCG